MRPQEPRRKIRALVVDDEQLARTNLVVMLRSDPEIEIIGECASGMEALAEIRRAKPDLVFLDVQMPEYDGFDVLEMLGNNMPPALHFRDRLRSVCFASFRRRSSRLHFEALRQRPV